MQWFDIMITSNGAEDAELKALIRNVEDSTGTTAMEYQEYSKAVLKLCAISRNQADSISRLRVDLERAESRLSNASDDRRIPPKGDA